MRKQFHGEAIGGLFAGAEGAFAGEAVEVVAGKFERGVRNGELLAHNSVPAALAHQPLSLA